MLIEKLAKTHNIRQVADCYAVDDRRLINVRHKSSPTLHRKTGKQEFGVPLRDYQRYVRSRVPFYLFLPVKAFKKITMKQPGATQAGDHDYRHQDVRATRPAMVLPEPPLAHLHREQLSHAAPLPPM